MSTAEIVFTSVFSTAMLVNLFYLSRFQAAPNDMVEEDNAISTAISLIIFFLYGAFLIGKYWEFLRPYLSLFK